MFPSCRWSTYTAPEPVGGPVSGDRPGDPTATGATWRVRADAGVRLDKYVISLTHTSLGRPASKARFSKFGDAFRSCFVSVVTTNFRRTFDRRP